MLEIAICDDDKHQSGNLEGILFEIGKTCNLKLDIEIYHDGKEIVEEVLSGKRFDIIFMDIMMEEVNGLEAAGRIRELDRIVQLVYVTSHDSYMGDAFRTAPIGFIKKPVEHKKLKEVFLHALKIVGEKDAYYRFQYRKAEYKVLVSSILYCESHIRKIEIVTEDVNCIICRKLDVVEKELSEYKSCFIRIHESYLVNYRYIVQFSYDCVELMNGKKIPISRSRSKETARLSMALNM